MPVNNKISKGIKMEEIETINGVIIQRLPTIGEPLSIKTKKQGRRVSIADILKNNAIDLTRKNTPDSGSVIGKRAKTGTTLEANILNAKRIIAFQKSSTKQKEMAEKFIKRSHLERGATHSDLFRLIVKINRSLCLTHKDY